MVLLSIIIPVFNEKDTLLGLLKKVEDVDLGKVGKEIILVDDLSTDGTRGILKKLQKKYKVFYHKKNKGKGRAIRTGLKHSTGDIIIIQDSDLEYDPEDYKKLLRPILDKIAKVVYGSRFKDRKQNLKMRAVKSHYFGNRILSFLFSVIFFTRITDMETCYKMFTRDVLKNISRLRATRFEFEPEITAKIIKAGYRIKEVPIRYYPRGFEEGTKINWKDGVEALFSMIKFRFVD